MTEQLYLIQKRGLYYAPDRKGYTGIKEHAGRYTLEECALNCGPNGPDGPCDGITYIREEDAPDYTPSCFADIKEKHMQNRLFAAHEEIDRLRGLLREVRDKGLVYWEPVTSRGELAKADMCSRIEAALASPNSQGEE